MSMISVRRASSVAAIFLSALALMTVSARAASSQAGGYCQGPDSVGAINQYCEDLPSSTGPQPITGHTHAIVTVLPPATVRALDAPASKPARAHRQELLTLPAPQAVPIRRDAAPARASTAPADTPLILTIALIAVVMALLAVVARRRRRPTS